MLLADCLPMYFVIVALVGFEFSNYTANEDDGIVDICVILANPPVGFDIELEYQSTRVTAGKLNSIDGVVFISLFF